MAVSTEMERAGRVIARWKDSGDCVSANDLARAAWRVAAGKRIAAHTTGVTLRDKRLLVRVEDDVWRRQLSVLRSQILRNLAKTLGDEVVTRLDIQVMPQRIGPGREEALRRELRRKPASSVDEADHIEDPVLRQIYRKARKRASA